VGKETAFPVAEVLDSFDGGLKLGRPVTIYTCHVFTARGRFAGRTLSGDIVLVNDEGGISVVRDDKVTHLYHDGREFMGRVGDTP
jgi:hypothetical protein